MASMSTEREINRIAHLIGERTSGHSLPAAFYRDPEIFEFDLDLLAQRWTVVDHASRIPEPGDWITVEIGADSFILCRRRDGTIGGFHNVCRHRGSRLCLEPEGHSLLLTCPYHAWSYQLDGSLRAAREMPTTFDPADHSLAEIGVRVIHDLIFISPEASNELFDNEFSAFSDLLSFHGLDRAKIAERRTYPTEANWKLVVENFLECYHCVTAHPEYTSVHSRVKLEAFGAGAGSGDAVAVEKFRPRLEAWERHARSLGHPVGFLASDHTSPHMAQHSRTPIGAEDKRSETKDGSLASQRLMGSYSESDGGSTGMSFSPTGYLLASCDFALLLVFRPVSSHSTQVDATWLVDQEAVAGVDYDIDRLVWVWDQTLTQDKTITENNQLGVASRGYQPGPYAMSEARTDTFVQWYLAGLARCLV